MISAEMTTDYADFTDEKAVEFLLPKLAAAERRENAARRATPGGARWKEKNSEVRNGWGRLGMRWAGVREEGVYVPIGANLMKDFPRDTCSVGTSERDAVL
jgi:hypothetical protein